MNKHLLGLIQLIRRALRGHGPLIALLLLGVGAPWFIFVEVAEDIWESGGFIGDQSILEWIHHLEAPTLDTVALAFTTAGGPEVMSLLGLALVGLLYWKRCRHEALFFALAVCGAVALNVLAKTLFGRPRPALWESIAPAKFYSFPSGHAMGSAALAAALGFLLWQSPWRWPVCILGTLFTLGVGLSRMYLGVHYPSDVLAGWVCSLGWVAGLHVLLSPDFQQLQTWWREGVAYWNRSV
ncbi:undecaprenyl-diphosphatase [Hymenobacter gelipurpurascens]|uniref:Undecaprenyl-diphosphatase n=1 Tax=Hymenobacter gelipurpurascens TaxID=89968 RepID=A0A212UAB3_9BACT|nr:phosphatase PAP2 family protein [Hymenobacter gelipurpurascens]SNC75090.1 undecaprenyl-diphosphatase [Hymenobacter gelipurpurascens]